MASDMDVKGDNLTKARTPSERRGSLVVDDVLAGEEDAAVLAKMGFVVPSLQS